MYRLLIVDDEYDIANGLTMYLKNITYFDLDIYTAYSGTMALEWLNRTKIDIVVTDIKMPGMSGLQLVEEVHKNWPYCKVVFLTGYNEFDYIYTAIKYDEVSYVLKTEGNEKIVKAIEKAIDKIENSLKINSIISESAEYMKKANIILQKEYFFDMIQEESSDLPQRRQQFEELGIHLCAEGPVLLMIGRIESDGKRMTYFDRTKMMCSVKLIAEKCFFPAFSLVQLELERYNLLWILQPLEKNNFEDNGSVEKYWNRLAIIVKEMAETLQSCCRESLNILLSLVYDSEQCMWENIRDKYEILKRMINYRIGAGIEMLIDKKALSSEQADTANDETKRTKTELILRQIKVLGNYLETGQRDEFINVLKTVFYLFKEKAVRNNNQLSEIIFSISLVFLSYINRWNLTEKLALRINLDRLTRGDSHVPFEEMVDYFNKLADIIFELQNKEEEDRALTAVNRIKQYINDNISGDLSIVKLAEIVYFNPQYLSRLFKKVTNTTILSYINEVKLNKAKEMLRNSNYRIHDVAETVGFISAAYFTQFFKRFTGMSPQEYRYPLLDSN